MCTLCCKIPAVAEIEKSRGVWCPHCTVGRGCRIYSDRPEECRTFNCAFLQNPKLPEEWRPSKCRIIVAVSSDGQRVGALVDPDRPDAWRREPFYSTLKGWARDLASRPGRVGQVYAAIGNRVIVILPDREVDIGTVDDDEVVLTGRREGPAGPVYDALKVKRDDPRVSMK